MTFRRSFAQSWIEYCSETIEKLLDVDVELSCLENKLLFCFNPLIEKEINEVQRQHADCIAAMHGLQKEEQKTTQKME